MARFEIDLFRRNGCESGVNIDALLGIMTGTLKKHTLELLKHKVTLSGLSREQNTFSSIINPL